MIGKFCRSEIRNSNQMVSAGGGAEAGAVAGVRQLNFFCHHATPAPGFHSASVLQCSICATKLQVLLQPTFCCVVHASCWDCSLTQKSKVYYGFNTICQTMQLWKMSDTVCSLTLSAGYARLCTDFVNSEPFAGMQLQTDSARNVGFSLWLSLQ